MISRAYLIVFAALTVASTVMAMVIFPELDPVTALIGLLVQLTGILVVAYLRLVIASLTVLIMTVVAAWAPTDWQVVYDHQLIVWLPVPRHWPAAG